MDVWLRSLAITVVISSAVSVASADDNAVARQHFERGTRLYDLGRYIEAAGEYEKAFEAKPEPALLFNIGQAYRLGGRYSDAIRAYRSYLRRLPNADNRAEVEDYISKLQADQEAQSGAAPAPMATSAPPPPAATPTATPTPMQANTSLMTTSHRDESVAPHRPVYKRWWFWTIVGVAAAGAATGLAVGLTYHSNNFSPALGSYGPGALTIEVR